PIELLAYVLRRASLAPPIGVAPFRAPAAIYSPYGAYVSGRTDSTWKTPAARSSSSGSSSCCSCAACTRCTRAPRCPSCLRSPQLLDPFLDRARADRAAAFADGEARSLLERDRRHQVAGDRRVVARHHHLDPFRQVQRAGDVGRPDVELRPVAVEERRVPPAL